tara:strand:+ start:223 stop:498 length:276 start_codon:yes stop_codon:yes gene_type:complete
MTANRVKIIENVLEETFSPIEVEVLDESHKHVGHVGARSGKGHFKLTIISKRFEGLSLIQRQKLVYRALASLMETDIHALSMSTLAPSEMR